MTTLLLILGEIAGFFRDNAKRILDFLGCLIGLLLFIIAVGAFLTWYHP